METNQESLTSTAQNQLSDLDLHDQARRVIFLYKKVNPAEFAGFEHELDNPAVVEGIKLSIAQDIYEIAKRESSFSADRSHSMPVSQFRSVRAISQFHKLLIQS